ncbi:hypothetical protein A2866_03190 [Candidatus Roizmanbacteria bacterium RIFCSPHIGHO2_01_FULL_39_8]|uniref:Carotenoid oxygenase n=3 Tax=Candidatus Roizmaniibacteriota TaxID=1752723 RepID=A0A1F7GJ46_9BACT|nr:MAG: hypothetical protein A2866_03190 [Candidatus Roizmanbacteria bacterium RIFCSPHIGHO2_01_FULL_39_8]OGK27879.1 MAG: hypothetical protein A3C28_05470 [Candidatus Roizmanbacteria bacterium RIFCSPHIGHO2_02_FULL_39_9]OGK35783.1 MAG: hypothetical protein A3F60_01380 [Candidatus Roizmanbacteria bacterium RIFCSPHIGHO2_12_FULL_39_8]
MKTIIFDFDGTIADTWKVVIKILKEKEEEWGLPAITKETFADFRGKPFLELIKKYNIVLLKLPFVVSKTQKELKSRMVQVSLFKGVKEVIMNLKKREYHLGILTTNSKENVLFFLKRHGLDVFDFIQSEPSLLGKDKALRKILDKNSLEPTEVLYIGDEIRDIDACKENNVKIISVTWGFNTKDILKTNNPDFLVDHPSEILKIIGE